jgi:thiol-disulfide isomerase/thioredoxin
MLIQAQLYPMKNTLLILILFLSLHAGAQSKPAYAISMKINGLKDTTAYLGYFYSESTYLRDTAKVNSQGEFTFTGKEKLPPGMYFLVLNKSRKFDFLISNNQFFHLETDTAEFSKGVKNIIFNNDPDNKLFYENMAHNAELGKKAEPYVKILKDSTIKEENKKEAREAYNAISKEALAYQDNIIKENPTTLTARLLKSTRQIEVPDPPKRADGTIDSMFQFRYYREHFFDNFDLSDDAFIRLPQPTYTKKIDEYLDNLFMAHPDTLMQAIDKLVSKAKKNPETYKFMVWALTRKYELPGIMGTDEVFVQMYYKYYATGEMNYWANEKLRKALKDAADNFCKSLIGKTGPNLMMQDANFQPRSLYDIKTKYTIIYFYDPECGSCKKETPVLVDFYTKNKVKFNVEVFAVNIDSTMAKMRDYIKTMKMKWITVNGPRTYLKEHYRDQYDAPSTPTIYVLDEKKKIIAKKLPAAKLEEFLTNYEKIQKRRAAMAVKPPDRVPFDCSKPAFKNPANTADKIK